MPKTPAHSPAENLPIPVELIERRIYLIRRHKIMLDSDLADLYQVETKALNRAVHRNVSRFPGDFMFQLTAEEAESLRYQTGTSNVGRAAVAATCLTPSPSTVWPCCPRCSVANAPSR
jgi:hypothetical protein